MYVCVSIYDIGHGCPIRPCHSGHSMLLAVVLIGCDKGEVCVFIQLYITAQSGPCHTRIGPPKGGSMIRCVCVCVIVKLIISRGYQCYLCYLIRCDKGEVCVFIQLYITAQPGPCHTRIGAPKGGPMKRCACVCIIC